MVYQMWIRIVPPVAGQLAQRVWEVRAVRVEVQGARLHHRDQVVPVEILMIRAIGPVSIAPLLMLRQLLSVRCAITAGNLISLCKLIYLEGEAFNLPLRLVVDCGGEKKKRTLLGGTFHPSFVSGIMKTVEIREGRWERRKKLFISYDFCVIGTCSAVYSCCWWCFVFTLGRLIPCKCIQSYCHLLVTYISVASLKCSSGL